MGSGVGVGLRGHNACSSPNSSKKGRGKYASVSNSKDIPNGSAYKRSAKKNEKEVTSLATPSRTRNP